MLDIYGVRFLLAAESLAHMLAAWGWWRVWRLPSAARLSLAALATCLCFTLKIIRIAVMIVSLRP
jgi:hypothetical protein